MGKQKTIKTKVLVNLKYDKEVKKIGEELNIKLKDVEEMVNRGLVEVIEEVNVDSNESNERDNTENEGE